MKNHRDIKAETFTKKVLPEKYLMRMREIFGEGYEDFLASYNRPAIKGLRFNTLKARPDTVKKLEELWELGTVAWCSSGRTYIEESKDRTIRPGKSPYHAAGVFYIQEPSAMLTAEMADIGPNDKVLDLCAAPGGKSGQAACKAGFLLSNEIMKDRARILSSNIERMGCKNVIVSSAKSEELAAAFPEYFDRIITDAPCSGEGMMRRDDTAVREWSPENVELCVCRQRQILREAVKMLKPGGRLVYSTCTFEPEENIRMAEWLCNEYPEFKLIHAKSLYPHEVEGEGHFCAVMEKEGSSIEASDSDLQTSMEEALERLYKNKIHVLRAGVQKGEYIEGKYKKSKIYVPSHAEILAMGPEELRQGSVDLKSETAALRYLKGESIRLSELSLSDYELFSAGEGEFTAVSFDGYALGLGKYVNGVIKNHYPKGLRQL